MSMADINNAAARLNAAADAYHGKIADINTRIAEKEADVVQFIAEATPERRFIQRITVGGSKDYLYPVLWTFPGSNFGVGHLEISRAYDWNAGLVLEGPSLQHVAGLLLQMDGNGAPWSGDANYLHLKKYKSTYSDTASHLQFGAYAKRRSIDGNPPSYGVEGYNYLYSGVYLRGGGLEYVLSSNWVFAPLRLPNENDANSERILHTHQNTQFYVTRMAFADLVEPVEGTYV